MNSTNKKYRSGGGCGYLLFIVVTVSVMFIINAGLVGMVFSWYEGRQPWIGSDMRYRQVAIFLMPVVMVLMEFWIFDFIVDRISAVRNQMDS